MWMPADGTGPLCQSNGSCSNVFQYGGKVGSDIVTTYTVEVLQTPSSSIQLSALIMDVSGNSIHYNSDFRQVLVVQPPSSDLTVIKTALTNPVEAGEPADYLLTVINPSNDPAEDVVLTDTLPMGLTFLELHAAANIRV